MALTELRLPFLETKIQPYDHFIALLYRAGRASVSRDKIEGMALEYCERSRMRSYLNTWAEGSSRAEIAIGGESLKKEKELLQKINRLRMRLMSGRISTADRNRALAEIDGLKLALRETKLSRELATSGEPTGSSYPDILLLDDVKKRIFDSGTCIIEYFVGEESSFAWLIQGGGIKMAELPHVSHGYPPVILYIDLLSQEEQEPVLSIGRRIYRDLILPFQDELHDKRSVIIVPDDVLNYLPFESLPAGKGSHGNGAGNYLVDEFEISYAPSISTLLAVLDRTESHSGSGDRVLALGDPINGEQTSFFEGLLHNFSGNRQDEWLSASPAREVWSFPRLKKSEDEVRKITALFPEQGRTVLLGGQANEAAMKREPRQTYQVLHFAAHGIYDESKPEFSAL